MSKVRLSGFDENATRIIRSLEDYGWTFTVSNKTHALGKAPDGVTTCSIARALSLADRSQQNSEAVLKAWERKINAPGESLIDLSTPLLRGMRDFHPERVADVATAVVLGWLPEVMVNGAIRLTRSGTVAVVIRKSDRRMSRRERDDVRSRVLKGGDPLLRSQAAAMDAAEWADYVLDVLDDTVVRERVALARPQAVDDAVDEPATRAAVVMLDPSVEVSDPSAQRLGVLSRRPWLARQGTSRKDATADLYESHAVVEVTYENGTVRFECATGCGYTSSNPRSVSSHFRAHVRAGEAEAVGSLPRPSVAKDIPIDPASIGNGYTGKSYHPSSRLLDALAEWLSGQAWDNTDDLALLALTWFHDRPDLGDAESRVREPLTDAEVIAKIRLLVGGRDPETEEALRNALATVDRLTMEMEEREEAYQRGKDLYIRQAESNAEAAAREKARADSLQADMEAWLSLAPHARSGKE